MSVEDKIHFGVRNAIGSYTLVSDVAPESAYPLTNMQNQIPNDWTVFDMTSDTEIAITWSSATADRAGYFFIHNHNLLVTSTMRLRLYSGEDQTGSVVYDSTVLLMRHEIPWGAALAGEDPWGGSFEIGSNLKGHFSLVFENVTYKSAQLDLVATETEDDLIKIDKIGIGPVWAPTWGQEWSWVSRKKEGSEHTPKPGGGFDTVPRENSRGLDLNFVGAPYTDRIAFGNILDRTQKSGDMFICCDPNNVKGLKHETTGVFKRFTDNAFAEAAYNSNSTQHSFEEN